MIQPNATPQEDSAGGAAEMERSSASVLEDLETLRSKAGERDEFLSLLQRTRADFENYQKRMHRELAQERRFAQAPLAEDLLPVLDNLDRATAAAKQVGESGPLVQGVAMVQSQLLELLRRHGVTRMEALGQPFDPHLHQAVMQQPAKDAAANTVIAVPEQGFMIHERVLRPARVVVAAPPSPGERPA